MGWGDGDREMGRGGKESKLAFCSLSLASFASLGLA